MFINLLLTILKILINIFNYKGKYCYFISKGVRMEVNKSADKLDHAFVCCTKYYKGNFNNDYKRNDYVVDDVNYNKGTKGRQVDQIVCIDDAMQDTPHCLYCLKQLFIVQYMQDDSFSRNDGRTDIQTMSIFNW